MTEHDDSTAAGPAGQRSDGPPEPVVRDKRRIDPETGEVRAAAGRTRRRGRGGRRLRRGRFGGSAGRPSRSPRPRWWCPLPVRTCTPTPAWRPSGCATCSGCRPSTSTTSAASTVTGRSHRDVAVGSVIEAMLPGAGRHPPRAPARRPRGRPVRGDRRQARGRAGQVRGGALRRARRGVRPDAPRGPDARRRPSWPRAPTTTTVVQVLQPGYRIGERVIRAARVAVADPE